MISPSNLMDADFYGYNDNSYENNNIFVHPYETPIKGESHLEN